MKAFPHIAKVHMLDGNSIVSEQITSGGMDLRDYFAAKALQSLTQNFLAKELDELDPTGWMTGLATDAYTMADAMMEARNAK